MSEAPAAPPAALSSYSDPECFAVARRRAADAGANGWQADVQDRVLHDSYDTCRMLRSAGNQ